MFLKSFSKSILLLAWTLAYETAAQQTPNRRSIPMKTNRDKTLTMRKAKSKKYGDTQRPSSYPSSYPSPYPSPYPSSYPSTAPSKLCDFENVAITELADPFDAENGTMIELTFLDKDCKNRTIPDQIVSLLFGGSRTSSTNQLRRSLQELGPMPMDLRGAKINRFGGLLICESSSPYNNCDFEPPRGRRLSESLSGPTCVCSGPPAHCAIKDQYGKGDCSGSQRTIKRKLQNDISSTYDDDYSTGQAQRLRLNKPEDRGKYIKENWNITKNVPIVEIKKSAGRWSPQYNISTIITEVFEFNSTAFVKLFALDKKDHGAVYSDEMKLVRFVNGSKDPDWESAIPLNYIPDDGLIVICNEAANNYWADSCTIVIDDSLVTSETDAFAIINGFEDLGYFVRDKVGSHSDNGSKGTSIIFIIFLFQINNHCDYW